MHPPLPPPKTFSIVLSTQCCNRKNRNTLLPFFFLQAKDYVQSPLPHICRNNISFQNPYLSSLSAGTEMVPAINFTKFFSMRHYLTFLHQWDQSLRKSHHQDSTSTPLLLHHHLDISSYLFLQTSPIRLDNT